MEPAGVESPGLGFCQRLLRGRPTRHEVIDTVLLTVLLVFLYVLRCPRHAAGVWCLQCVVPDT